MSWHVLTLCMRKTGSYFLQYMPILNIQDPNHNSVSSELACRLQLRLLLKCGCMTVTVAPIGQHRCYCWCQAKQIPSLLCIIFCCCFNGFYILLCRNCIKVSTSKWRNMGNSLLPRPAPGKHFNRLPSNHLKWRACYKICSCASAPINMSMYLTVHVYLLEGWFGGISNTPRQGRWMHTCTEPHWLRQPCLICGI